MSWKQARPAGRAERAHARSAQRSLRPWRRHDGQTAAAPAQCRHFGQVAVPSLPRARLGITWIARNTRARRQPWRAESIQSDAELPITRSVIGQRQQHAAHRCGHRIHTALQATMLRFACQRAAAAFTLRPALRVAGAWGRMDLLRAASTTSPGASQDDEEYESSDWDWATSDMLTDDSTLPYRQAIQQRQEKLRQLEASAEALDVRHCGPPQCHAPHHLQRRATKQMSHLVETLTVFDEKFVRARRVRVPAPANCGAYAAPTRARGPRGAAAGNCCASGRRLARFRRDVRNACSGPCARWPLTVRAARTASRRRTTTTWSSCCTRCAGEAAQSGGPRRALTVQARIFPGPQAAR